MREITKQEVEENRQNNIDLIHWTLREEEVKKLRENSKRLIHRRRLGRYLATGEIILPSELAIDGDDFIRDRRPWEEQQYIQESWKVAYFNIND